MAGVEDKHDLAVLQFLEPARQQVLLDGSAPASFNAVIVEIVGAEESLARRGVRQTAVTRVIDEHRVARFRDAGQPACD